jgi:excinuclease UvrABC ATPase subunit
MAEPVNGLRLSDIGLLMGIIGRPVDAKNTVICSKGRRGS